MGGEDAGDFVEDFVRAGEDEGQEEHGEREVFAAHGD